MGRFALVELPRMLGQLGGATFDLLLTKPDVVLPARRRGRPKLHRSECSASALDLLFRPRDRCLPRVELRGPGAQLCLTEIELQRAVSKDLLHPEMELTGALLALLERNDRLPDLRRALLELFAVLGEQVRDLVG
ncbi:MAG TPA: hypothetical protein VFV56_09465, partial [Gaiellaceae bacterium]|nr:hypothetical protein [Gaiellaceae bacterium]